jgi:hypothetical protein
MPVFTRLLDDNATKSTKIVYEKYAKHHAQVKPCKTKLEIDRKRVYDFPKVC